MNMNRILRVVLMVTLSMALAVGMWGVLPAQKVAAATCVSVQNGIWADVSTWTDCNGTAPVSGDSVVIRHTVTLDAAANVGTGVVTVESGGVLNLSSYALTANTLQIDDGGEVQQGGESEAPSGTITTRSYSTNSTYTFNGTQIGLSGIHPTYGNLNFAPMPGGNGTFGVGLAIQGDLTINLGDSSEVRFATGSTPRTHVIMGDLNVQNGIVVGNNGSANSSVSIGGNLNVTGGTFRGTNGTGGVIYTIAGNLTYDGGTWQLDDGGSTGVFVISLNGTTQQIGGAYPISVDNLTVNAGSTVTINQIPIVDTLTNNGILKQTQTVNNATVNFLTINTDKYRGVDIQTTNDLGAVTVAIQGNADACTNDPDSPAYIKRCFSITPTNDDAATLTLWATDGELNGITNANLALYRYVAGWIEQLTNFNVGTGTNNYNYVTADVDGFSSFLMGHTDNAPTAVNLSGLNATSTFAALAVGLLAATGLVVLRKRK